MDFIKDHYSKQHDAQNICINCVVKIPGGQVPRQSATASSNNTDLICIASNKDDDADDAEDVCALANTNNVTKGTDRKPASKSPIHGAADLQRTKKFRSKCHLCSAEINGQLGSLDVIMGHFEKHHDVHNLHIHQIVKRNGKTIVKIGPDIPKLFDVML